jgi:hypothetical protein
MSELLDLPPELIEDIFWFCEEFIYQELEDAGQENVVTAPLFRLANRYIERCTRRIFALSYFHTQSIRIFDDASIGRFCDITQSPELARSVDKLEFYATNGRHGRREISSVQRKDLVDALRACSALDELVFCDPPNERPHDPQRENRTEGDPEAPASHNVFDLSSMFSFALSVAEAAGLRLNQVRTSSHGSEVVPHCGLADCSGIAERKSLFHKLELFNIDIIQKQSEQEATPDM